MSSTKGLSQVLYLIIAAAVLMLVGLSLVFGFSGSTNTTTIDRQSCYKAMAAHCATIGGSDIDLPSKCTVTSGGETTQLAESGDASQINGVSSISGGQFSCS